jgi:hypothetical protein
VDTFMYGFWGEGHTWPYRGHPFPDAATAEATFIHMFEVQLEHWKKMLVAFSCRGRSFCPSCEKKRQLLWAEWLSKEVLAPVSHRHVVLTIPRLLRPLFRRRRELLTELGRAAAEATTELVRRGLGHDARPGLVVSIATARDLVQWHPHLHLLTTDGGKAADGSWQPQPEWDASLLMRLFRESLLAKLVLAHAISAELVKKLLAWRHPGFSAHVGETIAPTDKRRLEDTAAYLVRNPLSLKKLVYRQLFGTDRAFFYAAAFGRGTSVKVEAAKCPEFLDKFQKATAARGVK